MEYIQWTGNNQQAIIDFCGINNIHFTNFTPYNMNPLEKINTIYKLYLYKDLMPLLYVPLGYYIFKDNNNNLFVDNKIK